MLLSILFSTCGPPSYAKAPESTVDTMAVTSTSVPKKSPTPAQTLGIGSGISRGKGGMEMLHVPAGKFMMGNEDNDFYDF